MAFFTVIWCGNVTFRGTRVSFNYMEVSATTRLDRPLERKIGAGSSCFRVISMVDQPSSALFRQLTSLTVGTQSYSTVQHLHIEPNCGIIAFVNSTCKSILDARFGQLQSIHEAGSSLKGRQKLSFFDPGTGRGMARLCDCWRCAGRESIKRCLHDAAEIGEAVSR